jgi:hypothetical protein
MCRATGTASAVARPSAFDAISSFPAAAFASCVAVDSAAVGTQSATSISRRLPMSEKADVFTAVVREDGMIRKIVFRRQPDGSYKIVRKPTERLQQGGSPSSIKESAATGSE